ncbi:ABC transporter ATP-binding protein [Catenovulum sediminis]|uniref:ABC transporter ATP-binding protein n=1 Tax=Catenovulum sediminis TaxID=1740262 RepID=A0ABV1RCF2_9ALTE|nr:ABC transporter ATP-binding protein [Catenovulum sediminis]
MIELQDVNKHYAIYRDKLPVINNINMVIGSGEMVSIIGRSGSGKSTLLNLIGCLDTVSSGKIMVNNQDVSSLDSNGMANLRNERFGFVFQSFNLIARSSAIKNVEVPMIYKGIPKKERIERAEKTLAKLNMFDRKEHYPRQLSGGQQQRVAIARALVNKPDIILADEPTGALDSKNANEIMQIFRELTQEGKTVIIVTHDPKVAEQSDRVFEMEDGYLKGQ